MYRKFREETLDDTFVKRIQDIIGRSITSDAPTNSYSHDTTVGTPVSNGGSMIPTTVDEYAKALISLQQKHIKLLEDYNILLTKLYTGR